MESRACFNEIGSVVGCDLICFGGLKVLGRLVRDSVNELLGEKGEVAAF